MINVARQILLTLCTLLLTALLLVSPLYAASSTDTSGAGVDRQELVALQQYVFWQQINEARKNPLAVLARLEIPFEQAKGVFAEDTHFLVSGLPPLALNAQLGQAASLHARDMIENIYYSHLSQNGFGPMERIAQTGYQASIERETLAALLFSNPIELERGVALILDNIMRDELTGTAGVTRNIFSHHLTEIGISFDAEVLSIVEGQPFVYLLVLDFAKPMMSQRYVMGEFNPGGRPAMRPIAGGQWQYLDLLRPGLFQAPYPEGGVIMIVVKDNDAMEVFGPVSVPDNAAGNHFVDLRTAE